MHKVHKYSIHSSCAVMSCVICSYLDAIERALTNGDCVLIENMGESIDAVLDPLVGRNTIKKGRQGVMQCAKCTLLCAAVGQHTTSVLKLTALWQCFLYIHNIRIMITPIFATSEIVRMILNSYLCNQ